MDRGRIQDGVRLFTFLLGFVHIRQTACFGIPEFLEFGECAEVAVQPDVNFERLAGIWFNVESVPNEYSDVSACSNLNYTWTGQLMTSVERGLNIQGTKVRMSSLMRPTEGEPGVLTVDAEGVPSAPYKVLATDYDTYSCVYSCMSLMGFRASFSWIFSRVPEPDPIYRTLCRDVMAEKGVDPESMVVVKQGKDCPYVDKLDSLLSYSQHIQAKAAAKEETEKSKVIKAAPHDQETHPASTSQDLEALQTTLQEEEERLRNLERKIEEQESEFVMKLEEEENEMLKKMEDDHLREEEELRELREEVTLERRHNHRKGHSREHQTPTGTASHPHPFNLLVMALSSAALFLTFSWL